MKQSEYNRLEKQGIINGCGGKGGFNFSKVMRNRIAKLPEFKQDKFLKLVNDIELQACGPHDVDCYKGGGLINYFIANGKFSINIFKLLHWTNLFNRLIISVICFIGLTFGCFTYFNWFK